MPARRTDGVTGAAVLEVIATGAESLGVRGQLAENDDAGFRQHSGCPPSVTVLEEEVSTVDEFVYLGALIHSPTHSFPDIMRRSAFTRTAMQSLDKQLWQSRISLSTKLRLYNTCILPIFLYGSECWAITKEDASRINTLHQWCHRMLLGIKWYHFISNNEVRRQTNQPLLTEISQARRLTLFEHIARMDDNVDAEQILTSSPSVYWKRPPGRPLMTWMTTMQNDLDSRGLSWTDAVDLAQNRPLWRLLATNGTTHSCGASRR